MSRRLGEITFGAIGACFGITGGIFALSVHYHPSFTEPYIGIILSILGLIGAFVVGFRKRVGSALMIASGIGGLISLHQLYALAGTLLIGAGLLALAKKPGDPVTE
ncbi:MAG: hypothetical protein JWN30_2471 [Bacilli bacterium]|nr:hypothetical protein [Bacilli bacterium]